MLPETPEEFWHQNIKKYKEQPQLPVDSFPQNLIVTQLMKMSKNDIAIFRGSLKRGDLILISYPTSNKVVKNFIGLGIGESEYRIDNNTEIYPVNYPDQMNDDFLFSLLVDSYGWRIKDYGDLSQY